MPNRLLLIIGRGLLSLRYRVRVAGLDAVAARGTRSILFLANHPALVDPAILHGVLAARFAPHALADYDQVNRPFIRWLSRRFGAIPMRGPSVYGTSARPEVEQALAECARTLRAGGNVLVYPAGHIARERLERIGGNSAVEAILRQAPEARVVLIRTRGLWGSRFSRAAGRAPDVGRAVARGALALLASGVVFAPRRPVSAELREADDLPRTADRATLNGYLESYFNDHALPNTYVPYALWERGGGARVVAEPPVARMGGRAEAIPEATRELVLRHLAEVSGRPTLRPEERLAADLGLDSLALLDLSLWLESEFGFPVADGTLLHTVADVLLASRGTVVSAEPAELKPIPAHWFPPHPDPHPIAVPEGETIAEVFWRQARRHPRRLIVADQISGVRSYRDLLTAVLALKPDLQALPGEYVGIMLPASVAAVAAYLAVMFAGKTPVMVNWTVGTRSMIHSLDLLGVGTVLTAERVIQRVQSQVGDLGTLRDRFLLLEDLRGRLSLSRKIAATLRSRFDARALAGVRVTDTAVVLFTSGSESLPKAVPLTHANLLANIRDIALALSVRRDDRLIGMLPPFHSFGLTCTVLLSLCGGIPAAYHANPTEGTTLARLIEAYRCTMLIGTPTFLGGIIRSADDRHLQSLRLVVSGAEKCPAPVYEAVARRWPKVIMLEGYGVTECSPVVSVNDERAPRPQTIGKVLRSFAYTVADAETHRRVEPGRPGVLLLRGPCVFPGYLKHEGASPFVECEGQQWYRTGDLVVEDAEGVLTFAGRLKRFIKLAGEMISLPAIEDVLTAFCGTGEQGEPLVAVECTPQEINPELVLFTPLPLAREEVNRRLRAAGLSPLHNIRVVRRIERIPTLGTGKTDYRALRQLLVGEATSPSARRT